MRINEITQEQKVNIKCLISKCDKGKTVKDTPYLSLILEDATLTLGFEKPNSFAMSIERTAPFLFFNTKIVSR